KGGDCQTSEPARHVPAGCQGPEGREARLGGRRQLLQFRYPDGERREVQRARHGGGASNPAVWDVDPRDRPGYGAIGDGAGERPRSLRRRAHRRSDHGCRRDARNHPARPGESEARRSRRPGEAGSGRAELRTGRVRGRESGKASLAHAGDGAAVEPGKRNAVNSRVSIGEMQILAAVTPARRGFKAKPTKPDMAVGTQQVERWLRNLRALELGVVGGIDWNRVDAREITEA